MLLGTLVFWCCVALQEPPVVERPNDAPRVPGLATPPPLPTTITMTPRIIIQEEEEELVLRTSSLPTPALPQSPSAPLTPSSSSSPVPIDDRSAPMARAAVAGPEDSFLQAMIETIRSSNPELPESAVREMAMRIVEIRSRQGTFAPDSLDPATMPRPSFAQSDRGPSSEPNRGAPDGATPGDPPVAGRLYPVPPGFRIHGQAPPRNAGPDGAVPANHQEPSRGGHTDRGGSETGNPDNDYSSALRQAARQLEATAADLEDRRAFDLADALREQALGLRRAARNRDQHRQGAYGPRPGSGAPYGYPTPAIGTPNPGAPPMNSSPYSPPAPNQYPATNPYGTPPVEALPQRPDQPMGSHQPQSQDLTRVFSFF